MLKIKLTHISCSQNIKTIIIEQKNDVIYFFL
nr:MAG TPA: hypothetical protein [Caudoviricetes sp.]